MAVFLFSRPETVKPLVIMRSHMAMYNRAGERAAIPTGKEL